MLVDGWTIKWLSCEYDSYMIPHRRKWKQFLLFVSKLAASPPE